MKKFKLTVTFMLGGVLTRARLTLDYPQPQTITFPILEPVKARRVINEQLLLALLADIVSFEEDIDRAVEAVSVRDIRAINPALIAELFDGERQQFLIDLDCAWLALKVIAHNQCSIYKNRRFDGKGCQQNRD